MQLAGFGTGQSGSATGPQQRAGLRVHAEHLEQGTIHGHWIR